MTERIRKRCVACRVPHLMDDLGPVKPGDEVINGICDDAIREAAQGLHRISDEERQGLLEPDLSDLAERLRAPDVPTDEAGVAEGATLPAKIVGLCIASAILLIAVGVILGVAFS